jgi:8-oxo-dGTP pyrophosphatase MutT (NUDIX family)
MNAERPRVTETSPVPLPGHVWATARIDELESGGRAWHQLVVTESAGRDGVVVVARKADGRIGLVRQWRHAVSADVWELPRGYGEAESADADARREVAEELLAQPLATRVVARLWANTGLTSGAISVVDVLVADGNGTVAADPNGEVAAVEWLSVTEATSRLHAAEPTDGISVAALALWRAHAHQSG